MSTVLIVDDNAAFRWELRTLLRKRFPTLEVTEASDGLRALQLVDIFNPDLVFMDISLLRESGLDLTTKIKADHSDLIVSILTNHDLPEYREAAFRQGADYFVSKGAPSNQLFEVVEAAIGS